jgi:ERCC4-type nuclease
MMHKFTLLQDTREKEPWNFSWYTGHNETIVQKLYPGDYSILGYEDLLAIERKRSVSEICVNLGKDKKRFRAELVDMKSYRYPYLICEFPESYIDSFPVNSGIPKHLWKNLRTKSFVIKSQLFALCEEFNVKLVFSEDAYDAQDKAYAIIQKVIDEVQSEKI